MARDRHRPTIRIDRGERRWLPWLMGTVVVTLLAAVGLMAVQLHAARSGQGLAGGPAPRLRALQQRVEALREENERLQRELAVARRGNAIDETAGRELASSLAAKERELAALREELSFYKSMVDTGQGGRDGIGIRSLEVTRAGGSGRYHYQLVLTSTAPKKRALRGHVELRVQGRAGGKRKILDWPALAPDHKPPRYRFQYFQRLGGEFVLPDGFEPENILVKVLPRGSRRAAVQQSFSWHTVNKGG